MLLVSLTRSATNHYHPLSLHDALPIYARAGAERHEHGREAGHEQAGCGERLALDPRLLRGVGQPFERDRKSTRLNSSHTVISYAVFCLIKKKLEFIGVYQ